MSVEYPIVQRCVTSWADLKIDLSPRNGPVFQTRDFASLDWDEKLEPSKVPGTGPMHVGRTRGVYEANGAMSMYKNSALTFKKALYALTLGAGYGVAVFDILAHYEPVVTAQDPEAATQIISVRLVGCRIVSSATKNAPGGDGTVDEMGLSVTRIEEIGIDGIPIRML